jgi:hypothetical protein
MPKMKNCKKKMSEKSSPQTSRYEILVAGSGKYGMQTKKLGSGLESWYFLL